MTGVQTCALPISLGDIGELFPDNDPVNRGRDSSDMLLRAYREVIERTGLRIVNLDCIVFAQLPKLTPFKLAMRQRIAELLELRIDQVNVKAKTGERVGPVGREEAIMAECIVLME